MNNITVSSVEKNVSGFASAHILDEGEAEYLVGRICTIVETLGLKDTQEKAAKDLFKQEIYSVFSWTRGARFIHSTLASVIRTMLNRQSEMVQKNDLPIVSGDYELKFSPRES